MFAQRVVVHLFPTTTVAYDVTDKKGNSLSAALLVTLDDDGFDVIYPVEVATSKRPLMRRPSG